MLYILKPKTVSSTLQLLIRYTVPCTPDNLLFLLAFEEFYLQMSPCQRMLDLSRGQTNAEPASPDAI